MSSKNGDEISPFFLVFVIMSRRIWIENIRIIRYSLIIKRKGSAYGVSIRKCISSVKVKVNTKIEGKILRKSMCFTIIIISKFQCFNIFHKEEVRQSIWLKHKDLQ